MSTNSSYSDDSSSESDSLTWQPPAPLLVVRDDGTDFDDVKHTNDTFLNGSSGNFASVSGPTARSAPSTPHCFLTNPVALPSTPSQAFTATASAAAVGGLIITTDPVGTLATAASAAAGCPSPQVQRSPSHSIFNKCDKASLKHLSTSTPTMTAQAQLTEPPTPKATKEAKVHTISKTRQKKFVRHFPTVDEDEKVLNHYSCALIGDILLQGHLYITNNYFAFYSNVFGYVTKVLIPILTVEKITKEKTARIIPNAVGIVTCDDKHVFGSLMSRDSTLAFMTKIWEKAKTASPVEPEIIPAVDSSESGEDVSERESPQPDIDDTTAHHQTARILKEKPTIQEIDHGAKYVHEAYHKSLINTLKFTMEEFSLLPIQKQLLIGTIVFLVIILFLSAGILLYRISQIQNSRTPMIQAFQENFAGNSEEMYNDLLQWQTHLHSKSAGAVHNFLDTHLDQIAKVRQSLEALSTLLIQNNPATSTPSADGSQKS